MKKYYSVLFLILCILCSCNQNVVKVPIERLPEYNLENYKRLAVGDVKRNGRQNYDVSLESILTNRLVSSRKFEILDRNNVYRIWKENFLNAETTLRNGENIIGFIPADAIITTTIINDNFDSHNNYSGTVTVNGKVVKSYEIKSTANVTVNFTITDVVSTKILFSRDFSTERVYIKTYNETQERVDYGNRKDQLFSDAFSGVVNDFVSRITPQIYYQSVEFFNPEEVWGRGILYAEQGLWKEALKFFETEAQKKYKEKIYLAQAYHNLGLCFMYSGQFENAHLAFEKAEELQHLSETIDQMKVCKQLEQDKLRLVDK